MDNSCHCHEQLEHHFTGVQAQRKSKNGDKIQQIYLIAIYLFCHKYWKCIFIRGHKFLRFSIKCIDQWDLEFVMSSISHNKLMKILYFVGFLISWFSPKTVNSTKISTHEKNNTFTVMYIFV